MSKGGDGAGFTYMVIEDEDIRTDWRTGILWMRVELGRKAVKWRGKTFNFRGSMKVYPA